MYLNYFPSIHQTCSGVVVSVAYWVFWLVGSFLLLFISVFFSFILKRLHEHLQLEISSKCDIKAETILATLCKFHNRRKGLRPMESNADHH